MQKVKRDQLWDVLRGGEWCRARVVNVLPDRACSIGQMLDPQEQKFHGKEACPV
jgi:hypothetical protein